MGPALLLTLMLHQTPPQRGAVVLLTQRVGVNVPVADAVTAQLRRALSYAGIESPIAPQDLPARLAAIGVKDVKECAGRRECAAAVGKELTAANVVTLGLTQTGNELTIQVEALKAGDAALITLDGFTVGLAELGAVFTAFAPFSERVRQALSPRLVAKPPPAKPVVAEAPQDAPKSEPKPSIVPAPVVTRAPAPAVSTSASLGPAKLGAIAAVGGAGVAAVIAGVLVGTGYSAKSRVEQRVVTGGDGAGSPLSRRQAEALSNSANAQFTGALVSGVVSVGLATAAGILWTRTGAGAAPAGRVVGP